MAAGSRVILADLDDHLGPAPVCVVTTPAQDAAKAAAAAAGVARVTLDLQDDSGPLVGSSPALPANTQTTKKKPNLIKSTGAATATVTLSDCLACSGCVTSAETVLLTQQSADQVLAAIAAKAHKRFVVSVAPQCVASFAVKYGSDLPTAFHKLAKLLQLIGFQDVLDAQWGTYVSLTETCAEFIARYRHATGESKDTITEAAPGPLPMLTSECPGWVLYAEKTKPEALKFIGTCAPPQQVMGRLIKHVLAPACGVTAVQVFHTTVMPCFDKKLEAARQEFKDATTDTPDVDAVLTATELETLMLNGGWTWDTLPGEAPPSAFEPQSFISHFQAMGCTYGLAPAVPHAVSGGYLETVFRYAAQVLFNITVDSVTYKPGRNPDLQEVQLVIDDSPVLRFATAYGFRNVQNITRALKRIDSIESMKYHFVEIMACPSGCANGGGQLQPIIEGTGRVKHEVQKETIASVTALLETRPLQFPHHSAAATGIYRYAAASQGSVARLTCSHSVLHT